MSKVYGFGDYDKYFSLKLNSGMWLIVLYLMRPYVALISTFRMGPGAKGKVEGLDTFKRMLYPDDFSMALGIVATMPVLLFVVIYMKRKPGAAMYVRKLWHKSTWLLGTAAVLNVVVVFVPVIAGTTLRVTMVGWVQIVLSIIIIAYLVTSKRVRDAFADFPETEDTAS